MFNFLKKFFFIYFSLFFLMIFFLFFFFFFFNVEQSFSFQSYNAKLSNFGLAKIGPLNGQLNVTIQAGRTLGYAAPEYIRTGKITQSRPLEPPSSY